VVLAEAAGPQAPAVKNIVVNGRLLAIDGNFGLQEVDEAARRKDRRTAGADVDQFFAGIEVRRVILGRGFAL